MPIKLSLHDSILNIDPDIMEIYYPGIIAVHPDVLGQNERIKSTYDNR